ncbi:MAG: winged helix-turn-helix transcriptional regulator [Phycisphaerae bacterium]|nr:winged helix-turn-helix transcriptional regulator [Phycisphaerae bacterium]
MLSNAEERLYQMQAEKVRALSHWMRVAILDYLRDGEQCVCDIAEHVGSERSNISKHLSIMVKAGILESTKHGLKVIYKVKTPCILDFFSCITKCIKEQAEESQQLLKSL